MCQSDASSVTDRILAKVQVSGISIPEMESPPHVLFHNILGIIVGPTCWLQVRQKCWRLWQICPFWIIVDVNSMHRVRSYRSWHSPLVTNVARTWRGESIWIAYLCFLCMLPNLKRIIAVLRHWGIPFTMLSSCQTVVHLHPLCPVWMGE